MIKGLFLMIAMVAGLATAYLVWLLLVPVTESDVEFRMSQICYGGQLLGAAVNGRSPRKVSCACVNQRMTEEMTIPALTKGADAMRQIVAGQFWRIANGEKPNAPDKSMFEDRDVLTFIVMLHKLDKVCAVRPISAAASANPVR